MVGILSVSIIPKFFNSNGFKNIAYQSELITKLRAIQLRAMHQTDHAMCEINITSKVIELKIYAGGLCEFNNDEINNTTKVIIEDDELSFSPLGIITFDSLGRPTCGVCEISIIGGEQTKIVKINHEGYIYASN